jgi:hypothetical protein
LSEPFAGLKRLWSSLAAKTHLPHRPAVSSSILAALLAVGVVLGFVATRANHPANGSFASTTTTAPTTTTPPTVVVPTTRPTTTTAPTTTTTTTAAVATGSLPCTPSEVRVSVSTSSTNYPPAYPVTITTAVTDVTACVFTPQPGGQLTCPVFLDVTNGAGNQVWPRAGQAEGCSPPSAAALTPGQQESVSVVWNQQVSGAGGKPQQAPPGAYTAMAFWSWSAGAGQRPYQAQAQTPFIVG